MMCYQQNMDSFAGLTNGPGWEANCHHFLSDGKDSDPLKMWFTQASHVHTGRGLSSDITSITSIKHSTNELTLKGEK